MARNLGEVFLRSGSFNPVSTVSSLVANAQLTKIQQAMELLQLTQSLTLGTSLVGIGVDLAGFKMMNDRFNKIDEQLGQLKQLIDARFDEMVEREYRTHLMSVRDLLNDAGLAHHHSDRVSRLNTVADALRSHISFLRQEIGFLLNNTGYRNEAALHWLWALIEGLVSAVNARIRCFAEAGEMGYASQQARVESDKFYELFKNFSAASWARDTGALELEEYGHALKQVKPLAISLREVQDQLDTRPLLLEHLHGQGISMLDFRRQLKEVEEPVLCLPV